VTGSEWKDGRVTDSDMGFVQVMGKHVGVGEGREGCVRERQTDCTELNEAEI
jgi:hypothetical protein